MIKFVTRNIGWATLHPKEAYAAHKAMEEYKKLHPHCATCGTSKKLQVHHKIPVWVDPSLVADKDNMLTLCMENKCHLLVGHDGNFRTKYVTNCEKVSSQINQGYANMHVKERKNET